MKVSVPPVSRLAAVAAVVVFAGLLLAQETTFRSNVNLVRIVTSVKNQGGELLGTLQRDEFEVYDNGVKQQVAVFEHQTAQPLSVALLLDTSGSTAKELKYESDSALRFYRALLSEGNTEDVAAFYTFNWEVREQVSFTRDLRTLENRLKLLKGEAGTSMYDAVYLASQRLETRSGRKVIVVITDGGDTVSKVSVHKALEAAQLADAIIYSIVVVPITNDAGRNIGGEHALEFMSRGTGGRTFQPTLGPELDKAFNDIITELRTQYMLGYYPKGIPLTKERFHKVEVRVLRPDLRVSARNGYYGESEGGYDESPDSRITVSPGRQPKPANKKP